MQVDTTFPARFTAKVLAQDYPSNLPAYCYPGGIKDAYVEGMSLEVFPDGKESWSGSFAAGMVSPTGISGCWTHPDPWKICVVSRGEAYVVNVNDPTIWHEVNLRPILGGFAVLKAEVIVLYDFTRLLALERDGVRWRTDPVSWDGLVDVHATEGFVHGKGWDAPTDTYVPFTVELNTGAVSGGTRPSRRT